MRRWIVLPIATLTTLSLATTNFALTKPEMETVSSQYAEVAKAEAPVPAKLKILTGKVIFVDHDAMTLTVKKTGWLRAQEVIFAVEEKAAAQLVDLKQDDWIDVTYAEADGKLIAQGIVRRTGEAGEY